MVRRLHALPVVVLTVVLTACASAPRGASEESCVTGLPPDPRSLATLIDSTTVHGDLLKRLDASSGLTLAVIYTDSLGAPTATVHSAALPRRAEESIEATLVSNLRRFTRSDTLYAVLAEEGAVGPRRVSEFGRCAPALINVRDVQRELVRQARALSLRDVTVVRATMFVDEDGRVGETRIEESSGRFAIDQAAVEVWRMAEFRPARIEGIPVGVWVTLPITWDMRGPAPKEPEFPGLEPPPPPRR